MNKGVATEGRGSAGFTVFAAFAGHYTFQLCTPSTHLDSGQ